MKYLTAEVDNKAASFAQKFPPEIADSLASGLKNLSMFRASYRRVTSLQAWRDRVIEREMSSVSPLFLEAQNDALLSIVLAHCAMWRPALQSLRSCMESVLSTSYYADHPVEFRQWQVSSHRMTFADLLAYFAGHPDFSRHERARDILSHLRDEYTVLSKAVHASATSFHMTKGGTIQLTNCNKVDYSRWNTCHRDALRWLNTLLIYLYSQRLDGPQNIDVRKCVSFAVPSSFHATLVEELNVHLFSTEVVCQ